MGKKKDDIIRNIKSDLKLHRIIMNDCDGSDIVHMEFLDNDTKAFFFTKWIISEYFSCHYDIKELIESIKYLMKRMKESREFSDEMFSKYV